MIFLLIINVNKICFVCLFGLDMVARVFIQKRSYISNIYRPFIEIKIVLEFLNGILKFRSLWAVRANRQGLMSCLRPHHSEAMIDKSPLKI